MELIESVPSNLYITDELERRRVPPADYLREKNAIQDLAKYLGERPAEVLPRFVQLAMEMTDGTSAGLSLLEPVPMPGVFRWRYLTGVLAAFEDATTPRDYSPCGFTLDRRGPVLSSHPERFYSWIADANIVVPEVLLVPLFLGDLEPMGTLWIVAGDEGHFHAEHARIATELASFVGVAVKLLRTEQRLQTALEEQELLTKEMSHRVKNLFAVTDVMVQMSSRGARSKEEMAESIRGRIHALASAHALIRRSFSSTTTSSPPPNLFELLTAVLKPHENEVEPANPRFTLSGPALVCGERALNGIALVFHELATNAAKYGALTTQQGRVEIAWVKDHETVSFNWRERGGPRVEREPATSGFGTRLLRDTVQTQFLGSLKQSWNSDGLCVEISIPLSRLEN